MMLLSQHMSHLRYKQYLRIVHHLVDISQKFTDILLTDIVFIALTMFTLYIIIHRKTKKVTKTYDLTNMKTFHKNGDNK